MLLGDVIAPCLLLGLAIGRIGCFLNGCCYGGPCDYEWGVRFPPESVPYAEQLSSGELYGIYLREPLEGDPQVLVWRVDAESPAKRAGLQVGDRVVAINGVRLDASDVLSPKLGRLAVARRLMSHATERMTVTTDDGRQLEWPTRPLPDRTGPIHATQVYSSLAAGFLCLAVLAYDRFAKRTGQVIAMCLVMYPVARFLLEIIRTDESGFAGTGMTISQNISLLLVVLAVGLWVYLSRLPADRGNEMPPNP